MLRVWLSFASRCSILAQHERAAAQRSAIQNFNRNLDFDFNLNLYSGSTQPILQLCQRFYAGKFAVAIGSGYIEEYGLHSGVARADVVD